MKKNCLNQIDNVLKPMFEKAIKKGFFSGAAAAVYYVEKKKEKRVIKTFGTTMFDAGGKEVTENSFFDLASLTKPLCTVQCTLSLLEQKKVDWDTKIKTLIGYKTGPYLKKTTIGQLLSHSSGIKAYDEYFWAYRKKYNKKNKKKIIQTILKEPLVYEPGTKSLYSDFGYILLGEIIEQVTGMGLDKFFKKTQAGPQGVEDKIFFKPLWIKTNHKDQYVATERCPWRKKLMQGEVHDEHCWLMGGVSGHAGLFGSIEGVLAMTENILKIWKGRGIYSAYSSKLLNRALQRTHKKETWCMGFDTPSLTGSSAGQYMANKSVGHLGYTGTSFWIDPEKELVVVLLTNRVHPSRQNENIKKFRPLFHDAVVRCLQQK